VSHRETTSASDL